MTISLSLQVPNEFTDRAEDFIKLYDLIDVIIPHESNLKNLKLKHHRTCRFCGLSAPHVKFNKKAHTIPELLGNKYLFSDFECDACNELFGLYENDLANMLGIFRTINKVSAKEKTPKFKSVDQIIKAEAVKFCNHDSVIISRENVSNHAIDVSNGKMIVKYKKAPYIPANVYKAILKIALSIINKTEVNTDYQLAIDYLLGKVKMHTHVLALYFQNFILSMPIPLNKNDLWFYSERVTINLYPPFFTQFTNVNNVPLKSFMKDMFSLDKVRDETEELHFELNKEDLSKSATFNIETKDLKETEFTPGNIKKIVIIENQINGISLEDLTRIADY